MVNLIYNLSLYNLEGKKVTGVLNYGIADKDKMPDAIKFTEINTLSSSDEITSVDVIAAKGTFTSTEILGNELCEVNGCMFVSLVGPPLTTLLSGNCIKDIGMQFNLIDSPGKYIGGTLQVDNNEYWCFLGTAKTE